MTWFRSRTLTHGRARAWISERMDRPLEPARDAALEAHIATCPACRTVEAEYRANGAALRRLPTPVPPRDLPARTLAALEVEARRVRPPRAAPVLQLRGARRSGGVAIGSLLTVALVAVVGVLLAGPVVQIPGPNAGATPFAIAPVDLAFVGTQGNVVRIYRTRLDQACPAGNVSCAPFGPQVDQVVNLPGTAAVSGLAFDPAGRRAAIAARSGIGTTTTYYVVELDGSIPAGGATSTGAAGGAAASAVAPGSAVPSTRTAASPSATRSARAAGTVRPASTPRPSTSARAALAAGATPRTSARPARGTVASAPGPTASASASTGQSAGAIASAGAQASGAIASAVPGIAVLPTVQAQPILREVIPTGASAAWSADGTTLAFSAMPADGSGGSDIYTWHPGEAEATAITSDHASTFASWAGDRIVGSVLTPEAADPAVLLPHSFVLDPGTGERRAITGSSLWLPSVDPTGRYVVAWSGTLEMAGMLPVPGQGELVFAAWSSLDPFAGSAPSPVYLPPSASPIETLPAGTSATATTPAGASAAAGARHGTATVSPGTTTAATAVVPAAAGASAAATPSAGTFGWSGAVPEPIDPSAQPSAPRLEDWVVGWSPDGSAFAVWEGTAVGVDTGTLSLHAVDLTTAGLDGRTLIMGPVVASRAFSIGLDRLAWSTPADSRGLSVLRVLVWGSFGRGELHSGELQQQGIFPAF